MVSARHSLVPHRAFIMTRVEVPREQRGTRGNKLNSYTLDINISRRHLEERSVFCTFYTLSQIFSPDVCNLVLALESVTKSLPECDHSNKSSSTVIFLSCNWLDTIRFSPI